MGREGRDGIDTAGARDTARWREVYRSSTLVIVAEVLGGLVLLLPFGALMVGGAVVAMVRVARGSISAWSLFLAALAMAFGGVLLRHGGRMILDALRPPRLVEGPVRALPFRQGVKARYHGVVVGEIEAELRGKARGVVRIGQLVRIWYASGERTVRRIHVRGAPR